MFKVRVNGTCEFDAQWQMKIDVGSNWYAWTIAEEFKGVLLEGTQNDASDAIEVHSYTNFTYDLGLLEDQDLLFIYMKSSLTVDGEGVGQYPIDQMLHAREFQLYYQCTN